MAYNGLNLLCFFQDSTLGNHAVKWIVGLRQRVPAPTLFCLCAVLLLTHAALPAAAQDAAALRALALERDLLEAELEQLQQTVELLGKTQGDGSAAVQRLEEDIQQLKQQLIAVSERQIALLQSDLEQAEREDAAAQLPPQPTVLESKPLPANPNYTADVETRQVARLHQLLQQHRAAEETTRQMEPTAEELALREAAGRDAARLARIPFSAHKVRLSGAEGSTALAQISARLMDSSLPESRRDNAPIASIRTYLFGTLIASESRSLQPVGKYHYVAKLRLQPGDTTVRMQGHRWEINLPDDINTGEYLLTLYKPPGQRPEFHIFSVAELLATEDAHVPDWLPRELGLSRAG